LGRWAKWFNFFVENFPAVLSKLHSTCLHQYFEEKHFFERQCVFINFGHWAINFGLLVKNFKVGLLKRHFTCPCKIFEARCFGKRSSFSDCLRKISPFCRNLFGGIVKTVFNVSAGIIWGKTFYFEKRTFFYQFRTLGENFWAVCQKL